MKNIYDEKSKFISNINLNDEKSIEHAIVDAMKKSEKIDIIYEDMDGNKSKRTIHPLQTFKYKDNNYITAYCELRGDIRHFEIERIIDIK